LISSFALSNWQLSSPTPSRATFSSISFAGSGANTDPDIFEFVYSTKRFPPDGANRGHYRIARIDVLTDQIHAEMNQEKRKTLCSAVQKIIAEDLPYLPLWFSDVVSVHRRFTPSGSREGSGELNLSPTGDFDFLVTLASAD
jgi:peptide/nickel transport system substrate-binding protein